MRTDVNTTTNDNAGVIAPPPLIFAGALLGSLLIHWLKPLKLTRRKGEWLLSVPPIAAAFLLAFSAARTMSNAQTPLNPSQPSNTIVTEGPYNFTRNPIYLGMTLLYSGIAILVNSVWPFFLLPLVLVLIRFGVIEREEAYLEKKFGEQYQNYKAKVRRWI